MRWLKWLPLIAALLAWLFAPLQANADEIRPALLDIKEQSTGLFAVTWKVPTRGDKVLAITPRLPESLELVGSPTVQEARARASSTPPTRAAASR